MPRGFPVNCNYTRRMTDNWSTPEVLAQWYVKIDSLEIAMDQKDLSCVLSLDAPISKTVMRGRKVTRIDTNGTLILPYLTYLISFCSRSAWSGVSGVLQVQ